MKVGSSIGIDQSIDVGRQEIGYRGFAAAHTFPMPEFKGIALFQSLVMAAVRAEAWQW